MSRHSFAVVHVFDMMITIWPRNYLKRFLTLNLNMSLATASRKSMFCLVKPFLPTYDRFSLLKSSWPTQFSIQQLINEKALKRSSFLIFDSYTWYAYNFSLLENNKFEFKFSCDLLKHFYIYNSTSSFVIAVELYCSTFFCHLFKTINYY